MNIRQKWRSPYVIHAIRVALVASVLIGITYVCLVASFDAINRHRLYAQVDARLAERLDQAARTPDQAAATNSYDNAHDVDNAPVFFWQEGATGHPVALTPGAPPLPKADATETPYPTVVLIGPASFRLQSRLVGGTLLVAGQSLADTDHVGDDLIALEFLAGPVVLVAVFLGTLLVGLKAAKPVELARRRQLEFTADASHELRTPLSVIEAEVSLALGGARSAAEYRDTLARVRRESARLRDIVEDLLWLSRFDSEPPPPSDEPVDVSAIATACVDRFDAVATSRGIHLSVQAQGEIQPCVNAPPEWVDRLTGVLVDNACRYAGRNGTVRITVGAHGGRVSLAVDDDGPGIAEEDRANLFDRFRRATDEGNGAGLGLAIGDAVVRATGGEWRIGTSSLGGARMEVRWHRSPGTSQRTESDGPIATESAPRQEPLVPR